MDEDSERDIRDFVVKVNEGVENAETASRLRELGVDHLQGFYFAKLMPVAEFEEWLAVHNDAQ